MAILMKIFTMNIFSDKKISSKQQAEHLLILSRLMQNGFSIKHAISSMSLMNKKNLIFDKIYEDLQSGQMIAVAMRHLELPHVIHNQLVIAQQNGRLQQTLFQSGMILQNKSRQKEKLRELLAYPSVILSFLFLMLVGMKIYIIPQMELTEGNEMINNFISGLVIFVIVSITGALYFTYKLRKMDEFNRAQLMIKMPLIGKTYLSFYQFVILQGLGMQTASGLNLHEICMSSRAFKKGTIQEVLANELIDGMNCGKNIYQLIDEEPILPNELKMILQSGDGTKEIAQDLILMSELKFDETQRRLKKILNMIQPILFAVIAFVIIITYLIVLLPVYGMMKEIS